MRSFAICLALAFLCGPASAHATLRDGQVDGPVLSKRPGPLPSITLEKIQALEKRAASLDRLGRTEQASGVRRKASLLGHQGPVLSRGEDAPIGARSSDVISARRSRPGSMISSTPWAQDVLIYQGDYAYNAWLYGNSFAVDYDSSGNLFAAVGLPDSAIHVFLSTDLGATWTDEMTITFAVPELQTQLDVVACDDGDSTILNVFYLYPGAGDLRNVKIDYTAWTQVSNALIADTVTSYWVTRDQYWGIDYFIYAVYERQYTTYMTWSSNRGLTWGIPVAIGSDASSPCVAYGGYSGEGNLYVTEIYMPLEDTSSAWVTRSDDYGTTWGPWQLLFSGGPGGDDVLDVVVCADHATNPLTQTVHALISVDYGGTGDLNLWVRSSTDGGTTWSSKPGIAYSSRMNEHLASVDVFRRQDEAYFYCAYYMDDTVTSAFDSVMFVYTDTDDWEAQKPGMPINDSLYAPLIRPQVTFAGGGLPGVAYAGAEGRNIYYDNTWFDGAQERDEARAPHGRQAALLPGSPNPFRERTSITYVLSADCAVSLEVRNAAGQLVRTLSEGARKGGVYSVVWDGLDMFGEKCPAGVYICSLSTGSRVLSEKMVLVK